MKVKLGFSEYDLINKKPEVDGADFDGITDSSIKTIWSLDSETVSPLYKKHVLFHEITHALLEDLGYDGLSRDENFVDGLGKEIYTLFAKNDMSKLLQYAER